MLPTAASAPHHDAHAAGKIVAEGRAGPLSIAPRPSASRRTSGDGIPGSLPLAHRQFTLVGEQPQAGPLFGPYPIVPSTQDPLPWDGAARAKVARGHTRRWAICRRARYPRMGEIHGALERAPGLGCQLHLALDGDPPTVAPRDRAISSLMRTSARRAFFFFFFFFIFFFIFFFFLCFVFFFIFFVLWFRLLFGFFFFFFLLSTQFLYIFFCFLWCLVFWYCGSFFLFWKFLFFFYLGFFFFVFFFVFLFLFWFFFMVCVDFVFFFFFFFFFCTHPHPPFICFFFSFFFFFLFFFFCPLESPIGGPLGGKHLHGRGKW